jgi:peptidoglycan/xylan/chitin deacetylase (PgdA/CDA1 family)
MSWRDLEELVTGGWEVASHTRTHPRLTALNDDALRHELEESRRECATSLGVPCDTLAYPYGDVDDRVASFAAAAGYSAAANLSSSLRNGGPHRWPRVGIYHGDTSWRFRLKTDRIVRRIRSSRMWPDHE